MSNRSGRSERQVWQIENGDVLKTLATMEDNSFDGVFMDSPYGLRFMDKKWDEELPSSEVCREVLRVCKPGTTLLAFGGTRTFHRLACHLEDAGWQLRDCLMWLYGEGMPKALNIGKAMDKKFGTKREIVGTKPNLHRGTVAGHRSGSSSPKKRAEITVPAMAEAAVWDGYASGLKPAWEPILMAMKPLDGSFADNAHAWGCGGLNIDACRIGTNGGTARSHQAAYPRKGDGTEDRSKCWSRSGHEVVAIDKGRYPANVILDKVAAELLDRNNPTSKSCRTVRRREGSNVGNGKTMNAFKSRRQCVAGYEDDGGPSRFFYCAKASGRERQGNPHPTVKPLRLCQYLARLILPPAGFRRLLVPYSGSGSEMLAALQIGWDHVIGIEREAKYVKTARRRLASFDAT